VFHLYDQTRRRITLAAFFLLCVVPTTATGVWCVFWQSPWHLRIETQRLARELGMDVALGGLRHPRPGTVVYEGLHLSDPETGEEVLRCGRVEATWTEAVDSQGKRPALVLATPQVEVDAAGLGRLRQFVEHLIRLQYGRPEMEVRIKTHDLAIRGGESPLALADVEGGIGAMTGGVQAVISFHLADRPAGEPVRARIVRNRQLRPPADGFEMDTAGTPLPCPLLALALPELAVLGPSSRFTGYLWSHETADGPEGELSGQCLGVDLDRLLSNHFADKLTGSADVTIQRARFRGGRLEEAAATLSAGPGVISRRLLDALATHMHLTGALPQMPAGNVLRYDQLSLAISLDARGLRLQGLCSQAEAGTILRAGRLRLLGEPQSQPLPVAALIRALVPAEGNQIPATRQADWLARRLPQ
jgi:hypothetical protein